MRVLLVDQITSTEVGFYAQLKGKLTKKRYNSTIVSVDHFSCLRFDHLQLNNKFNKTFTTKLAFKQYMAEHRVKILHNHCNNGRFHDNAFQQACHEARQQLTFYGVNAHIQNGIAEQAIQDLSESTQEQLLHAHAQ